MERTILKAMKRDGKPNKIRRTGFVPGVLNSSDTSSVPVQFEKTALDKIISKHGTNAKIWIELNGKKEFGFIKAVQTSPVEGKIIHVSIQLVTENQEVKMRLPLVFHGQSELERRMLQIQVCKSEIEASGKTSLMPDVVEVEVAGKESGETSLMPDVVEVEVAGKESGETVTAADFHLDSDIKILDSENEIYAVIKEIKEEAEVQPEEPEPAE